ncbi:hypothetical protein [Qipengyuania sediminis]|uniref:hypothetical protein n=1 Tax=Qipengyuania sediminis TaxID=1532023 RepID=UPI0010596EC7|nr:hypothetical protein [Qipengyuania sediminis]
MLTLLAVAVAAATPAPPALNPIQANALRCAVVFARGARLQAAGSPAATSWPELQTRGREYFVRVTAKLMDETEASREDIAALARAVPGLDSDAAVVAAMPACLPQLAAAGL